MGRSSKADAEICGEGAGVVDGAGGGELAGHADAEDVFLAEGFDGDGGDEGGVDAAAEADEGLLEAALADVVAGAEDEGVPGGGGLGEGAVEDGLRRGVMSEAGAAVSKRMRSSAKEAAWAMRRPSGPRTSEEPSKMRLSLPPTWLTMSDEAPWRRARAASISRRRWRLPCQKGEAEMLRMTRGCSGVLAGRGLGPLAHELFDGVGGVETARPEALVVPGVLADGDGEGLAVERGHVLGGGGLEVALLVEDVVEGQQHLCWVKRASPSTSRTATLRTCLPVVEPVALDGAAEDGGVARDRGPGGDVVEGLLGAGEEGLLFEEVGGRVAAEGELGEDDEVGAHLVRRGRRTRGWCGCFRRSLRRWG